MGLIGSRRVWGRAEAEVELRRADLTSRRGARRAAIRGHGTLTWYADDRFRFVNTNGARLTFDLGDLLGWRLRTMVGQTFVYRDVFLLGSHRLPVEVGVRLPSEGWEEWLARAGGLGLVEEPPITMDLTAE